MALKLYCIKPLSFTVPSSTLISTPPPPIHSYTYSEGPEITAIQSYIQNTFSSTITSSIFSSIGSVIRLHTVSKDVPISTPTLSTVFGAVRPLEMNTKFLPPMKGSGRYTIIIIGNFSYTYMYCYITAVAFYCIMQACQAITYLYQWMDNK